MQCSACQADAPEGASSCSQCAAPIQLAFPPDKGSRHRTRWVVLIGAIVSAVLVFGLMLDEQPGPELRVADVRVRTPVGWAPLNRADSDQVVNQMTGIVGSAVLIDFRGAASYVHEFVAIADIKLSVTVTTEGLAQRQQKAPNNAVATTLGPLIERVVGHRKALTSVVTSADFSGTVILIPDDKSLVILIVGSSTADASGDGNWILDHLTTT